MDALNSMQALGLELPSPAYLFGAVFFGLIGFVAFRFGRRNRRPFTLWLGVALMLYPYAASSTWTLYLIGLVLCASIYADLSSNR